MYNNHVQLYQCIILIRICRSREVAAFDAGFLCPGSFVMLRSGWVTMAYQTSRSIHSFPVWTGIVSAPWNLLMSQSIPVTQTLVTLSPTSQRRMVVGTM